MRKEKNNKLYIINDTDISYVDNKMFFGDKNCMKFEFFCHVP